MVRTAFNCTILHQIWEIEKGFWNSRAPSFTQSFVGPVRSWRPGLAETAVSVVCSCPSAWDNDYTPSVGCFLYCMTGNLYVVVCCKALSINTYLARSTKVAERDMCFLYICLLYF